MGLLSSIGSAFFSEYQRNQQNTFNAQEADKSRRYNSEMFDKANQYNTPANQKQLLKEAGLNPNMLYSQGGIDMSAQMGSTTQQATSGTGSSANFDLSPLDYAGIQSQLAQARLINEQAEGQRIENDNKREGGIDYLKTEAEYHESLSRITNIEEQTLSVMEQKNYYHELAWLTGKQGEGQSIMNKINGIIGDFAWDTQVLQLDILKQKFDLNEIEIAALPIIYAAQANNFNAAAELSRSGIKLNAAQINKLESLVQQFDLMLPELKNNSDFQKSEWGQMFMFLGNTFRALFGGIISGNVGVHASVGNN